ncbi:MAG TPA: hypothetical protein VM509_14495 [Planctomycetota bacterium]|nr:hypothetical protein [Planctomycetota bacterium]
MSTKTPKSAVLTELEKNIRPALDLLQKEHDQQVPGLRGFGEKLEAAIKNNDAKLLASYRAPFDEQVKLASGQVARASKLKDALKKCVASSPEDEKALKETRAKLDKLLLVLDKNLITLKGGQDILIDALAKASGVTHRYAEEYARLDDVLTRHRASCDWRIKQYKGFLDKAKAAMADRDRKLLPELKTQAAKFRAGTPPASEAQAAWTTFNSKRNVPGLDEHAREQFERELPALKKRLDANLELEAEIFRLHSSLEGLDIKPVDRAKAIALLKIPAAEAQTFTDILGLKASSMEKHLDEVGKRLKPPKKGKAMLEELRKAKLL